MKVSVTTTPKSNSTTTAAGNKARVKNPPPPPAQPPMPAPVAAPELVFHLGLWLSGLDSFLQIRSQPFDEANQNKPTARDWSKELYLTNSTLLLCSKRALQLGKILKDKENSTDGENDIDFLDNLTNASSVNEFSFEEISALSVVLKDSILLNKALLRAAPVTFVEWAAWSKNLAENLGQTLVTRKLIANAEREGENFLPGILQHLLENKPITLGAEADLRMILPLFAKMLKWLEVIGEMLENDEPLKPVLLLFARISEQTQTMMSYVNNRLRRFANEEDELFALLDSTVYAASMEIRKVYNFELVGLSEIRQTPLIHARIETAHGLMNDCFQQIIVNYAQLIDPHIDPVRLFPNFQTKLEYSLTLRRDLWSIQQAVQKAEQNQANYPMEKLHQKLIEFLKVNVRFLFYKDIETIERFIEEVLRTRSKSDIVPILHRFGAYLETLLAQVNMRGILVNHPFDYPKE